MSSNDIDLLMSRVHEINAKTAGELTAQDAKVIVAYHRHARLQRAAGHKTTKPERPKMDVLKMLNIESAPKIVPAGEKIRRI